MTTTPLAAAAVAYAAATEQRALASKVLTAELVAARDAGATWPELAERSGLGVEVVRKRVDAGTGHVAEPRPELVGYVGQAEAARILGVSSAWVSAMSRDGRLPHKMVGRYRRYDKAVLERLAANKG